MEPNFERKFDEKGKSAALYTLSRLQNGIVHSKMESLLFYETNDRTCKQREKNKRKGIF